jgi:hypothetical protein
MWLIRSPDFSDSFVAGRRFLKTITTDGRMSGCDWENIPAPFLHQSSGFLYPNFRPGIKRLKML